MYIEKSRGTMTPELKQKAEEYLGREFTTEELRFYPYLCSCAVDHQRIERSKTTEEEQDIMRVLEKRGTAVQRVSFLYAPDKRVLEIYDRHCWRRICRI